MYKKTKPVLKQKISCHENKTFCRGKVHSLEPKQTENLFKHLKLQSMAQSAPYG